MPLLKIIRYTQPFNLSYEVHGTGPIRLLFIMGLGATQHNWHNQVAHFKSLDDYSIAVFDNRGVGHSEVSPNWTSTLEMAKDVQDLATHLDWGSYHLIGASMGGMIAQELAILSPERILSLSLLSTHSGWGSTTVKGIYHLLMGMVATDAETRFANVGAMLFPSGFLETDAPGGFVPKVLEEKEGGYTMADVFRDREMHVATKVPRPTLKAIRAQGMCTHKLMPVLAILSHYVSPTRLAIIRDASFPVLVATGTEDLLVGAGNSTYLSEACGGTLRVFDGIGHSLAFQACEELNGVLHGHFGREVGMGKLGVGMSNIVLL